MTWVHRIDGAPGAGKTHTLLNKIGSEIEDGVPVDEIRFLTFTNAARTDAKNEIHDRFPDISRDDLDDMVSTTHSAALSAINHAGFIGDNDQIIQEGDDEYYALFAERNGMNYAGSSIQDLQDGDDIEGNGDVFFAINTWLASTYRDASHARKAPVKFPWLNIETFRQLQDKWRTYKRTVEGDLRLWEHHDYIQRAIEENVYPFAQVVLIDEFQDFSPLQYKYYKDMRDNGGVERIYIAGDPQQSIYSFRGADPYYFNQTDFDKETQLNETRRCRDEVATLARTLLETSDQNKSRDFTAVRDGGTVRTIRGQATNVEAAIETATSTRNDSLLLLTRTNKQWKRIARFLRKKGFPYEILGTRGWSMWNYDENAETLKAMVQLRDESAVEGMPMAQLLENIPNTLIEPEKMNLQNINGEMKYLSKSVWEAIDVKPHVSRLVEKLQLKEPYRNAIKNVLARNNYNRKGQIRLGTIHASKGLEADTVVLFPAYSNSLLDSYTTDSDVHEEENRVAYVAATRARDRLYVVRDFFGSKETMPMFEKPQIREVLA